MYTSIYVRTCSIYFISLDAATGSDSCICFDDVGTALDMLIC